MFILVVNLNLIIVIKPISLLIFYKKKIKNLKLNYKKIQYLSKQMKLVRVIEIFLQLLLLYLVKK